MSRVAAVPNMMKWRFHLVPHIHASNACTVAELVNMLDCRHSVRVTHEKLDMGSQNAVMHTSTMKKKHSQTVQQTPTVFAGHKAGVNAVCTAVDDCAKSQQS